MLRPEYLFLREELWEWVDEVEVDPVIGVAKEVEKVDQ